MKYRWCVQPESKWSPGLGFRHGSELFWCIWALHWAFSWHLGTGQVGEIQPGVSLGKRFAWIYESITYIFPGFAGLWLQNKVILPFYNPNYYGRRPHPACLQETSLPQSVFMLFPEVPRGMSHLYSQIKLAPAGIRKCIGQGHFAMCVRGHHKLAYARREDNWLPLLRKRLKIFM